MLPPTTTIITNSNPKQDRVKRVENQNGVENLKVSSHRKTSSTSTETVWKCPVCNRSLDPFTNAGRNIHINACLDGTSSNSSHRTTKKRKKTGPLVLDPIDQLAPAPAPASPATAPSTDPNGPSKRWIQSKSYPAPPYKRIPGTPFMVDAFQFAPFAQNSVYVLTHFHSDHYTGLHRTWNHGLIYCSKITATLLSLQMRMVNHDPLVRVLPMYERVLLHGCYVTLVDANHCPGAVLLVIESLDRNTVWIHTGDFRHHRRIPQTIRRRVPHVMDAIRSAQRRIVYLDTTYGDPKYTFPEQAESIQYCVREVNAMLTREARGERRAIDRKNNQSTVALNNPLATLLNGYKTSAKPPKTLFLVGTYFIGKEKILLALAKCCRLKIYAPSRKIRVYREMELLTLPDETDPVPLVRDKDSYAASLKSFDIQRQPTIRSFFFSSSSSSSSSTPSSTTTTTTTNDRFDDIFTTNPDQARVHVMSFGDISHRRIGEHLDDINSVLRTFCTKHSINNIVAFRPTGWAGNVPSSNSKVVRGMDVTVHGVPYSEHSTYRELRDALEWMAPTMVVPTVNVRDKGQVPTGTSQYK